ncbi:hypothetical protein [Natrononativus amylolyticus]|uniref:hypothetical protein n=1 Tax=Natrononativus amylolyticus TaxID=2963434 RepID=UPI0020CF87EC|nr:hypothetical protein [Natrononativus amylolyticus]
MRATDLTVARFSENPLITPESADGVGTNVNGPSVIRAPAWLENPLGRYYMYFAHHSGTFIRLAYADSPRGPWTVHPPGALGLEDTRFDEHIASPDVHVDRDRERIRLYFHGCCGPFDHESGELSQATDVATSTDGLSFEVRGETLGDSYFRVWEYDGVHYAVANDGHLYRSPDPLAPFERGQELFPRNRHFAVRRLGDDRLQLFLTRRGDRPERLMVATMDLAPAEAAWRPDPHPPETLLWPDREYEGGALPTVTSSDGSADEPTRALRDPAVLEDEGRVYLYYAIAGERGIAGAELRSAAPRSP